MIEHALPAWMTLQIVGIPTAALIGGVLIGAAAVVLYLSIGRIAGVSGIFFGALNEGGLWRWLFLAGVIGGAWGAARLWPSLDTLSRPQLGVGWLIVAGLLVGWGTRLGSGCTSGHGVCGLGRLAPRSAVAVLAFMGAGVLTASLFRHWLGVPA